MDYFHLTNSIVQRKFITASVPISVVEACRHDIRGFPTFSKYVSDEYWLNALLVDQISPQTLNGSQSVTLGREWCVLNLEHCFIFVDKRPCCS